MNLRRGAILLAFGTVVLAACSDALGPVDDGSQLERNRQVWEASGVTDYRMTVRLHGAWVAGSAVIEVRNGVPVSVTPREHAGVPGQVGVFQHHDTVEELFEVVARALAEGADRLEVRYLRRQGVPAYVDVDVRTQWADDEHGFTVEDFRVLR